MINLKCNLSIERNQVRYSSQLRNNNRYILYRYIYDFWKDRKQKLRLHIESYKNFCCQSANGRTSARLQKMREDRQSSHIMEKRWRNVRRFVMKLKIPRNAILLGGALILKKELVFCEVNHLMEQKHWPMIEVIALHITQNVQVNQTHWIPKVLYYNCNLKLFLTYHWVHCNYRNSYHNHVDNKI